MKLLVSCIPFDNGQSGISSYARQLLPELKKAGHDLTLFIESGNRHFFLDYSCIEMPRWTRRPVFSMLHHLLFLPFLLKKYKADAFLILAANRRVCFFYPLFTFAVVHDLAPFHVQNKYDGFRTFYQRKVLPLFVEKADACIAISHATAADIERFWHVSPSKIHVNYNGVAMPLAKRSGWLSRMGIRPKQYIFYLSRIEHPAKNHLRLIQAYESLPEEITTQYELVLAGADWHGADKVHDYVAQSPLRHRIRFTGFLAEEDLEEAFSNAAAYVFPSLFEGFGAPLLVAMHYGTPCASANTSSLPEVGKDAALYFAPYSTESMASAIRTILTNAAVRAKLEEAGPKQAALFTWAQNAKNLLMIYASAK